MNFYQKIRINKMNITQENIGCVFFYFQMEFYPLSSGKKISGQPIWHLSGYSELYFVSLP